MKKLISILVALAMMMALCLTAFAEDPDVTNLTLDISKKLTIAQGLAAPEDFGFTFRKVSEDGATPTSAMVDITASNVEMNGETDDDQDGYIIRNTSVDLSQLTFGHAGEYVYEVTENKPTPETTGMTYDNKGYTVTLRVGQDGKVDTVTVYDGENKVNPDAPTPGQDDDDDGLSGLAFNNTYTKIADDTPTGEDPTTPENPDDEDKDKASFIVTKSLAGEYSDATKEFKFTITVDTSGTNVANPQIKYYKVSNGVRTEITDISQGFTLKGGEQLDVEGAPVGTLYTVTENLANDGAASKKYTGWVAVTVKGEANNAKSIAKANSTQGENVTVENALVADGANSAAFTNENTKDEVTPTGILMNNLPYILLAVVAAGGLIAYLMMKRREANAEA